MIYLRLAGGLGNQLFQIAAAAHYSRIRNAPVYLVPSGLSRYRTKRVSSYSVALLDCSWLQLLPPNSFVINYLCSRLRLGKLALSGLSVSDSNFLQSSSYSAKFCRLFMDGYFQSAWTYRIFFETISSFSLRPPTPASQSLITSRDVVIHVRGTDFLSDPDFFLTDTDFYVKCIHMALARGYHSFAFVTDDPQYCRSLISLISASFPGVSFRLLKSSGIVTDFDILRISSARIMGNSTFSWWAAALSQGGPTWSTPYFTAARRKPFVLPGEIYVS